MLAASFYEAVTGLPYLNQIAVFSTPPADEQWLNFYYILSVRLAKS